MTSKERFFAALNFQETDRTPVYVLDGSSWVINEEHMNYTDLFALEDAGASLIVKHFTDLQSDLVTTGTSCWLAWANTFGAEVNTSKIGRTIEVEPCMRDMQTDIPELSDEELKSRLSDNFYVDTMLRQIRETKKLVGEEKALKCCICGPFTAAGTLFGTGEFMKQIAKRNKQIPSLLNFTSRVIRTLINLYYEAGIDVFLVCEPTASGTMIAPRTFKQHVVPYLEKILSEIDSSVPVMLHICGEAGIRIEAVRDLKIKAFSVDAMVDMEEMLEKAEHKICMMGNLAPSDQMVLGTPESVYAESSRLLTLAEKNGGGFLLSTGCDFPAGAPLENALAMVQAAEDFERRQ